MILLAYRGCLISATGFLQLLLSHPLPASVTAMALAAITTRTDGEKPGRMLEAVADGAILADQAGPRRQC
jgi:hypothetical protein